MRLPPAVDTAPQHAEPPDELVARVDGHQVAPRVRRVRVPGPGRAAHQHRLDVGPQHRELRCARHDPVPGRLRHVGLGRPGRARIGGHDPVLHGVAEQEREPDRDLQLVPGLFVERGIGQRQVALRHGPVLQLRVLVGEQQVAGAAGAQQCPAVQIDHVGVRRGKAGRAHVAALPDGRCGPAARELAQRGERSAGAVGSTHDGARAVN
nr:hypothetical protein GCM10020092_064900 [Actinoplanes digitatis]